MIGCMTKPTKCNVCPEDLVLYNSWKFKQVSFQNKEMLNSMQSDKISGLIHNKQETLFMLV